MNTTTEPRQCPACSAAIPVDAPHGLCPKCLLLGIASTAEPPSESGGFDPNSAASALRPHEEAARDNRFNAPSIEDLNAAFPQLEIIELIGRGGMGFVYKARQPKLDRFVALKILPGHLAQEPSFHERFEREARVLAKLQHPLIVSVHDFGEAAIDDGAHFFYLMLEYVDGVNLREAMRAGRFTPDQALAIVPQVCEALQYAHSKGVLHRDIKPENILLDTDGRVKIADFGIAKVLGPEIDSSSQFVMSGASESEMAVTRLTATGSVLGTPLYMAPEQLINPNSVDHRADIFSLGVVFYEMLTGELPMGRFAAPSEKALANQQIDHRIDDIVLKALAKEKELRQQSAGEMKSEVETVASQTKEPRAMLREGNQSGSSPGHSVTSNQRRTPPTVPVNPTSTLHRGGWRALVALFIGPILSAVLFLGSWSVSHASGPPPASLQNLGNWMLIIAPILFAFLLAGFGTPIWLGWRHLSLQRQARQRDGIFPAMIAFYFFPLLLLDGVLMWLIHLPLESAAFRASQPADRYQLMSMIALYLAGGGGLLIDAAILVATWRWVTHTNSDLHRSHADQPRDDGKATTDDAVRRVWGFGLIVLAIGITIVWGTFVASENQRITTQWFRKITTAQHVWQSANATMSQLESKLSEVSRRLQSKSAGPADEEQLQTQKIEIEKQLGPIRDQVSMLEGEMKILSGMGSYRHDFATFLPVACFAVPLAMTGVFLIVRRRRVAWAVGATIGTLAVVFASAQLLTVSSHSAPQSMIHGTSIDQNVMIDSPNNATIQPVKRHSAAAQEAKRLGLILVGEASSEVYTFQGPIKLKGGEHEVSVEPHFSALVELVQQSKHLKYQVKQTADQWNDREIIPPYPCDYIACDWSSGTDKPLIQGYMRPPGAYDFRADAETNKWLNLARSPSRAELAAQAQKLTTLAASQASATESDWQQATQAAHVRMKFVPKAISKLEVPEECLLVLTEDSRTVFTREGGRFSKWELQTTESIRELRESFLRDVNSEQVAPANILLLNAHRAVRQQNWEELLNYLTDDCRSEWMLEIQTGCELALAQVQARGNVNDPKSLAAMNTLMQLKQELKQFEHDFEPLEAKRLDLRFKSYSTLSAAERRQFRIDFFQARYDHPGEYGSYYEAQLRLATTILTFVQQLNESQLVIDLSTVSDLRVEDDRATGTWIATDGKRTPIILRLVKGHNSTLDWKIDSLIGKSVLDAPFPGILIPGESMLEPMVSPPTDDNPADATAPVNGFHSGSTVSP